VDTKPPEIPVTGLTVNQGGQLFNTDQLSLKAAGVTDASTVVKYLFQLAKSGDDQSLSRYLSSHKNLVNERNNDGQTILHLACANGTLNRLMTLLMRGVDIESIDNVILSSLIG
jgi:ankyrin repeat protein